MKIIKLFDNEEITIELRNGERLVVHASNEVFVIRSPGQNLIIQPATTGQINVRTFWPGLRR